jgi:hypothetical protein
MMTFDNARDEKELYYTIAHEHGHEWFPMMVGSNERLHGYDEGLTPSLTCSASTTAIPPTLCAASRLNSARGPGSLSALPPEAPIVASGRTGIRRFFRGSPTASRLPPRRGGLGGPTRRSGIRAAPYRHPTPATFRTMNDALGEDRSVLAQLVRGSDHLDRRGYGRPERRGGYEHRGAPGERRDGRAVNCGSPPPTAACGP